ncbi:YnbE family lipoprotein [Chlorobaculum sp. 24CR]
MLHDSAIAAGALKLLAGGPGLWSGMNFFNVGAVQGRNFDQPIRNHMKRLSAHALPAIMLALAGLVIGGCSPTVKVEAPDKPITINMNIKIDHEIRIRVDRDIDNALNKRTDIF